MSRPAKCICFGCLACILLLNGTDRCNADNYSSLIKPPMNWDQLCPFSDFCDYKAARNITLTSNEVPCCETCSCDPDCGLQRNCCLYSMDRYRLDERYHTSCSMFSVYSTQISEGMGYKVVDQCANFTPCTSSYMNETPLGSLYPVYSRNSDMIFMNEACAACNGETKVLKWNVEINCLATKDGVFAMNLAEMLKTLLHESGGNCDFKFTPPQQTNVQRHTCSDHPSGQQVDCLTNYNNIDMRLKELCMGFNASFTNTVNGFRYSNIFCYLCTVKSAVPRTIQQLETRQICKTDKTTRGSGDHSFSLLLSLDNFKSLIQNLKTKNENQPGCDGNIVMERKSGRCRKIRCPEGQIEMDKRCTYISNDWLTGPITAIIRLEPSSPVDMLPENLLRSLSSRKNKIFKSRMKSWNHYEFYMNDTLKNGLYVNYFVVWLWQEKIGFDPIKFMADFQKDLSSKWTIMIDGKTYKFEAKFNKFYKYHWSLSFIDNDYSKNVEVIVPASQFTLNETEKLQSVRIDDVCNVCDNAIIAVLTKLFFCEQVDLELEEYVDYGNRVYFNVRNTFLEEAEFRRTRKVDNVSIISVCIEDFGNDFWKPRQPVHSSASNAGMGIHMALVSYLIVKFK